MKRFLNGFAVLMCALALTAEEAPNDPLNAVVKLEITKTIPNYWLPWQNELPVSGAGTGTVIPGGLIHGATMATERMFLTEPIPSPTMTCPSKLVEDPFRAEATTRMTPTRAMVPVKMVWKTEAALMPKMLMTMMAMVNSDAMAIPLR